MAYTRFLTNKDYCSLVTEEHWRQIVRDVPERIPQAEQRAEMQMREYLDQYYEIEKVLAVGKNIREYNHNVTYPGQVWIVWNDEVYKTMTRVNGIMRPTKTKYWKQMLDFINPLLIDHARKYSQQRAYSKGDVVKFGTEYWQCVTPHGIDTGEIHIPGVEAWKEVEATPWEPGLEWKKDDVCSYEDNFYQYLGDVEAGEGGGEETVPEEGGADETDGLLPPTEDEKWGLIGGYSDEYEYAYGEDSNDYVVCDGSVFRALINPNADKLEEGVNVTRDDPRNPNVIAHMTRIALYHLHSIISPTNISETRRWAYEDSIQWLYNASKFKINPQLPRKRESDSCLPKVDWALATYQRDFNPDENAWLI